MHKLCSHESTTAELGEHPFCIFMTLMGNLNLRLIMGLSLLFSSNAFATSLCVEAFNRAMMDKGTAIYRNPGREALQTLTIPNNIENCISLCTKSKDPEDHVRNVNCAMKKSGQRDLNTLLEASAEHPASSKTTTLSPPVSKGGFSIDLRGPSDPNNPYESNDKGGVLRFSVPTSR